MGEQSDSGEFCFTIIGRVSHCNSRNCRSSSICTVHIMGIRRDYILHFRSMQSYQFPIIMRSSYCRQGVTAKAMNGMIDLEVASKRKRIRCRSTAPTHAGMYFRERTTNCACMQAPL